MCPALCMFLVLNRERERERERVNNCVSEGEREVRTKKEGFKDD